MTHLPGRSEAHLTEPVLHLIRAPADFHLAAKTGLLRDDGERVDLAGEVRGRRLLPNEPATDFASESLVIWPQVESAKSIDRVTISQNGAIAEGNRMDADNVFGIITLTGDVTATIPAKRKNQ